MRKEGEPGAGGEYKVQVRHQRDSDFPLGLPLGAVLLFVSFSGRFEMASFLWFPCDAAGLRLDQRRGPAAPGPLRRHSDIRKPLGASLGLPPLPGRRSSAPVNPEKNPVNTFFFFFPKVFWRPRPRR